MQITEFEKKRAANLIWNGAQDYTIETGFRVYDEEGRADVYWNSIIGAVHLHYDWDRLMNFYQTFNETVDQNTYESLFWLAIENAVFCEEESVRPVFPYLRKEYAVKKLDSLKGNFSLEDSGGQRLLAVMMGHMNHCLGKDAGIPDAVDRKLLDAIELDAGMSTDEIIDSIAGTLSRFFTYRLPGSDAPGEKHYIPRLLPKLAFWKKKADTREQRGPVRKLSFGYAEHAYEYGSDILDQSHLSVAFASYSAQTDEGLKEYIKNSFGKPLYSDAELCRLQKDYCYGNHTDVKLYFTDGSYEDEMLKSGYAGKMKQQGIAQAAKNEKVYESEGGLHRQQIEKLTERIRNTMLTHMEDSALKTKSGTIVPRRIWRGLYLHDDRIFTKIQQGDTGDITVDLILDASTSQLSRQESVSAQGYIIAESLTRCGIPVRVTSFCSLNGYTIVNVFRDYNENNCNSNIFRYFTTGANRDGLAVRLAAGLMKDNHAQHRIMIILSDCRPNDVLKMRNEAGGYDDYAADAAIMDTAAEVHAARLKDITVLCVYTGPDNELENARKIYGRDFAHIRSFDQFADTVGSLIQRQIALF